MRLMHGREEGIITRFMGTDQVEIAIDGDFTIPVMRREVVLIAAEEAKFLNNEPAPPTQAQKSAQAFTSPVRRCFGLRHLSGFGTPIHRKQPMDPLRQLLGIVRHQHIAALTVRDDVFTPAAVVATTGRPLNPASMSTPGIPSVAAALVMTQDRCCPQQPRNIGTDAEHLNPQSCGPALKSARMRPVADETASKEMAAERSTSTTSQEQAGSLPGLEVTDEEDNGRVRAALVARRRPVGVRVASVRDHGQPGPWDAQHVVHLVDDRRSDTPTTRVARPARSR